MSARTPDVNTLIDAVMLFIKRDAIPHLPDYQKFQGKVTLHVLDILKREYANGLNNNPQLASLSDSAQSDALVQDHTLAEALRSGSVNWQADAIQNYVRESVIENITLSNPRWLR